MFSLFKEKSWEMISFASAGGASLPGCGGVGAESRRGGMNGKRGALLSLRVLLV